MISRHAVQAAALSVFVGFGALPAARAADAAPPAISREAATAVAQMTKTLLTNELSFTAKIIRVYLDESGQPLHVFHDMKVVVRRPDRLSVEITGDDGAHDLFYDGSSVSIFYPDRKEYAVVPASGDVPSALETLARYPVDFPLSDLFAKIPERSFLRGVVAGWEVGTAIVDGVECRHLFFLQRPGVEMELWVENNNDALPHRLIVTYRLLPGQPNFIAQFTSWDAGVHPADAEFAFQPPADARKIELRPAAAPGHEEGK